jgi:glycosyltransferase involved in cell wall biosynthesis
MKITFVLPFINLTGGVRVMLDYANWLHDAGHHVTVVYPTWPYRFHWTQRERWLEFRKQRTSAVAVPWMHVKSQLLRAPLIRTWFLPQADVVIATAWPTAHDVARLADSRGRKVHVVMHHEGGTGQEWRIRATYGRPFYRITLSRQIAAQLHHQFGCDIDDVVPASVDPHTFFPDGPRERDSVLLLYHPDPRKGGDDGIEALARLRGRRPGVQLHIAGTVRPSRAWPAWLPFEFHPDDAAIRRAYSASTVFLYPSRYEGFGLPPLEAMACGCPVVTTATGAIGEYCSDRQNALIVRTGDVDAMVDRLAEIIEDPALQAQLAAAGQQTAKRYLVDRVAPMFAAALERAVDAPVSLFAE